MGSSKAMEASVGVQLLKETATPDAAVKTVIVDDDAITIAHIHKEYNPDLQKWSDINHAKKSPTNSLYNLSKKYKFLTNNTNNVINYFRWLCKL